MSFFNITIPQSLRDSPTGRAPFVLRTFSPMGKSTLYTREPFTYLCLFAVWTFLHPLLIRQFLLPLEKPVQQFP